MKKLLTLFTALLFLGSLMTVRATTWTVAGSDATLLGASWSQTSTANDMINISGNDWYLLKANTSVNATLEYKVVKDHDWGTNYPQSNASIALSGSSYDVLFKFVNDNNHSVSAVKVTSWTVAGSETVMGSDWSTTDTNNDMTRSGNNWTLTKSHVLLAVGTTYQCKVAANHAWTYAFPGSNKDFSVTENGYYDVTIDFNTSTLAVTVTTTFMEPAVPPTPTISLHSNITGSWATSDNFAIEQGDETASLTISNVAVGGYELGVKINNEWTTNGASFTRANPSNMVENGSGNCTFVADIAGDYTFTWTYETNTLAITYPDMTTAEVKFFAPRTENNHWDNVYAFVWNGTVVYSADFPGDEITSTKNAGWYKYNVPVGASIIFSDGAGMQTANIENITTDVCYVPTAVDNDADPKMVTVVTDADCKVEYYIAGSQTLIGGTTDFDTNVALDENNQIVFHDVMPGTYAFKININNWAWSIGGIDHMKEGDCATIAQEVGIGDLGFRIETKQDVTVTYYPGTQEICLGAVTVKADPELTANDMSIVTGESKAIAYSTNNTESPAVTYSVVDGEENIVLYQGTITGVKAGEATVRVSIAETANYTSASAEFTVTVSNPADPAKAIEAIGGKFIINAKGDTAVFSRGNLTYNVATEHWYCAAHQYNFVGENGNLHFGDVNYKGELDLFGWSCTASNYGLLQSNHDEVYTGEFVDWGGLFAGGEQDWSSLAGSEMTYIINHHQWTTLILDPTPEDADNEDEILGVALFPYDWVKPAGFENLHYSLCNWYEEEKYVDNTIALSSWSTLEEAGAVFMPMAGARAGHWGNTWNGKAEDSRRNPNPNGGNSYCFVDNIGWYGYYWSSTTDPRSGHPYDAQYLIFPGWSEGPTLADEDDQYLPPVVWSREKRRGNSVRLVHIIPRQYTVSYDANGAEGTLPTDAAKYLDGANVTLANAESLHKDGYVFAGWKFKDVTYDAGDAYTIANVLANEEIVFEAQWEPAVATPDYSRNVTIGNYATICLPNGGNLFGAQLYDLEYYDGANTLYLLEVNGNAMVAGRPYIFLPNVATIEVFYTDNAGADAGSYNGLVGSYTQEVVDQGDGNYILYNNAYYFVNSLAYVGDHRAYIHMEDVPNAPAPQVGGAPRRRVAMTVNGEQVATGMDDVQGDNVQSTKVLINGQLYILRGEKMFDATGRLVK